MVLGVLGFAPGVNLGCIWSDHKAPWNLSGVVLWVRGGSLGCLGGVPRLSVGYTFGSWRGAFGDLWLESWIVLGVPVISGWCHGEAH